eukprot:s20_g12.t1
MAEGGATPQAAMTEAQQAMNLLQQMMQEQAQQRQQMNSLQHAIGTTAQGVGTTQPVTEGVVNEVQQEQSSMVQRQQETQEQFQQVVSAVQGLQYRLEALNMQVGSGVTLPQGPTSATAAQPGTEPRRSFHHKQVLECIKDTQPASVMDMGELSLQFPGMDHAILECSNSNLFVVLITYTLNEARNIVRQARRPNGYEALKLLHRRFNPVTIGTQRAGRTSIANPSSNIPLAQLSSEIVPWEAKIAEFEARPNSEKISESIKMAAIVSMCLNKLKELPSVECSEVSQLHRVQRGDLWLP